MPWVTTKQFTLEYEHLVSTGETTSRSCNAYVPHIHTAEIEVSLYCRSLNTQSTSNVVNLVWFENLIETTFHGARFVNESEFDAGALSYDYDSEEIFIPGTEWTLGKRLTPTNESERVYFLLDFDPTHENLAEWVWKTVQCKIMESGYHVVSVEWKTSSTEKVIYTYDPDPEPPPEPTPEELERAEKILEERRNRFTPPPGGFKLT